MAESKISHKKQIHSEEDCDCEVSPSYLKKLEKVKQKGGGVRFKNSEEMRKYLSK